MPHSLQQAIFLTSDLNTLACQDAVDETDTSTIIEEESVHAQLAWEIVQWLLNEKPNLKTTAKAAFEPVFTGPKNPCSPLQAQNEPLHAHGHLDSHHPWHAHRKASREIIRPAALVLLR